MVDGAAADTTGAVTAAELVDVAFEHVIGQETALAVLAAASPSPVHAYLFLGSPGSGSLPAALGFAGLVLAAGGDPAAAELHVRRGRDGTHPDLIVIEPEGATIRVVEAEQVIRAGLRTPREGSRKVVVVKGVDAIEEAAIGKLLKVIEEPPASAVFVLLAEEVPPELVTIASRCVTVEFGPLSLGQLEGALVDQGVDPDRAMAAAAAAGGDAARAQLLASDDSLASRVEAWRSVPDRLDGTGSAVVELVTELRAGMDDAQTTLEARHTAELEQLAERVEQLGERGSGRTELVARHRREIRRLRSDELRFGLATLARVYRDRLVAAPDPTAEKALSQLQTTAENLIRNPNEALLLQHLLMVLSPTPR